MKAAISPWQTGRVRDWGPKLEKWDVHQFIKSYERENMSLIVSIKVTRHSLTEMDMADYEGQFHTNLAAMSSASIICGASTSKLFCSTTRQQPWVQHHYSALFCNSIFVCINVIKKRIVHSQHKAQSQVTVKSHRLLLMMCMWETPDCERKDKQESHIHMYIQHAG